MISCNIFPKKKYRLEVTPVVLALNYSHNKIWVVTVRYNYEHGNDIFSIDKGMDSCNHIQDFIKKKVSHPFIQINPLPSLKLSSLEKAPL